uniref:Uncharacterized protein n=1 Tax=Ailuropoda melanoleuca TaxID=9646 RepID=A0A7N5KID6_AILME
MNEDETSEIVREKSWQKRQVVSVPFLPGRIAGGPGKGRRLFMARNLRDLAPAAEKGASTLGRYGYDSWYSCFWALDKK